MAEAHAMAVLAAPPNVGFPYPGGNCYQRTTSSSGTRSNSRTLRVTIAAL